MSAPPPPRPEQALSDAEAALARGEPFALDGLNLGSPRLDPDEPRRSAAELVLLSRALGHARPAPSRPEIADPPRAGYQSAIQDGEPVSWPALAEALANRDRGALDAAAADLWRLDADLWAAHTTSSWEELALGWLTSPGRRLLQDLDLLTAMATPGVHQDGATDLSWRRLGASAGAPLSSPPPEHAVIHAAWPGAPLSGWRPLDAVHALYTLEQGSPAHARGGALCWLLTQAATAPVVSLAGVRRHLGDELPARLAVAFSKDTAAARAAARAAEVESLCLAHAARIARARGQERDVGATWRLARWIQTTTMASPFYGGDPESLAARLRALLPVQPSAPSEPPPPLAPARFGAREHPEIDLTEHAWVSAAAEHYADAEAGLRPVPQPLIDGLRAIARRPLTAAERALERTLGEGDTPHVAPPLVARQVLSEGIRASWLGALDERAGQQLVELLDEAPGRVRWLATAALDDGDALAAPVANDLLKRWRDPAALVGWEPEERCALGLGLHSRWERDDPERCLDQLSSISYEFKMPLMKQLLSRASGLSPAVRERAITALVADAERADLPGAARVEALGIALPWVAGLGGPTGEALLERARRLTDQRPFRDSVPLRRELRRLGLGAA